MEASPPPLPLLYGGHNGATAVGRGRKAGRELKEKGERETERPNVLFLRGGGGENGRRHSVNLIQRRGELGGEEREGCTE